MLFWYRTRIWWLIWVEVTLGWDRADNCRYLFCSAFGLPDLKVRLGVGDAKTLEALAQEVQSGASRLMLLVRIAGRVQGWSPASKAGATASSFNSETCHVGRLGWSLRPFIDVAEKERFNKDSRWSRSILSFQTLARRGANVLGHIRSVFD